MRSSSIRRSPRLLSAAALILLAALLLLGSAAPALAGDFRGSETITIAQSETIDDDVFLGGTTIVVDGTVKGNLFAVASDVTINGTVEGSVFAAARTVLINGKVNGMVMAGAVAFRLGPQATVARNAILGAYAVTTDAGAGIGRDLVAAAEQMQLGGKVGRDAKVAGSAIQLSGSVGRDMDAAVSAPGSVTPASFRYVPEAPVPLPSGLDIAATATIAGKLTYRSTVDQSSAIRGKAGSVVFRMAEPTTRPTRPEEQPADATAAYLAGIVRDFVTLVVLGLLVVRFLPGTLRAAARALVGEPLPSLGWGILLAIAGYMLIAVTIVVLLILVILLAGATLGGLAGATFMGGMAVWGVLTVAFQLLVSFGSKIVVSYLLGRLVLGQMARPEADHPVWPLLLGVLLYVLIRSIPVLGGLVNLAAVLLGLGALWLVWYGRGRAAGQPASI